MAYAQLTPRHTPSARVDKISSDPPRYRLTIPPGKADSYRLAQLDDYSRISRRRLFPHRFELSLSLSARTSSDSIPGTWGFGLWNDPFGLSIGFGGKPFRLPALPNAAWFFGASEENYLSLQAERNEGGMQRASSAFAAENAPRPAPPSGTLQREMAANGFLAQSFRSPKFHPLLIVAGLAFPFSRKQTRRLMSRVVAEDGVQLRVPSALENDGYAREKTVSVDPRQWHRYRLEWREKRVSFEVDEAQVLETSVSPNPPLGLVIWIDNQYAAFTPEGRIGFGVLENPEPAWLEIKNLEIG